MLFQSCVSLISSFHTNRPFRDAFPLKVDVCLPVSCCPLFAGEWSRFEMRFEESKPFRPIEQLMGVLPAASCKALPKPCRPLMTDKNSPIIDFYPKDVREASGGRVSRVLLFSCL